MKKINIKDYKIIHGVPPPLKKSDRCAIDTEFLGMNSKRLHRPTGEFACATFYFGTDEVYIVESIRDLPLAFSNIEDAGWIFHNAKFDVYHLRRFLQIKPRKMFWDTMLVEQVMFSGLYDEFNLAACCRRHLDLFMEKETREEFENHTGELTPSQIEYACIDTIATHQLFLAQRETIDEDSLKVWKNIELPFFWCLLSVGGITLDKEKWLNIAKENEEKAQAIQDKYGRKVPKIGKQGQQLKSFTFEGINLASPKQVKEEFSRIGYKLEGTGEEFVSSIANECEFAKDLLEFRTLSKRAGTYGMEFLENHVEADGKIYTDYFQIGAISGRLSSRSPNLQNQPRGGGYRDCYVAEDGNELVIADSTAQEPKFAAYLCQDENFIEALNSNEKLYVRIARDSLGIVVKKGEEAYNHMKSTILGLIYGMSAHGLSAQINKPEEEAQELIDVIKYKAYPKLGKWIDDSQSKFKDYVCTVSGRKIWLNEYTSAWKRLILNAPIQGSAAEAFKLGVVNTVMNWHGTLDVLPSCLRLFVHDEEVCEVAKEDVEKFIPVLTKSMIDASESLHVGIKAGVEVGSGASWASKV